MSVDIRKQKEAEVAIVADKIKKSKSVVLVDYRGISVEQDTALRSELRKANVEYKVIKNRILSRAMEQAGVNGMEESCKGPTAVAFGYDDAVDAARILTDYVKKTNKISVKSGVVENRVMDAAAMAVVASIPAKPVLIAQLLGMLTSPIRSMAVALSEIAKKNA